ncbi:hypothetical protein ISN45_Aa03g001290 [Arabidopsis thaliana x Arabidopsis arenosa]|uniref:Transmembrane protein n=1 Tax=Arabidopsis thaliana x Arabidopsis arenosa TaxID=1240361 RepID=A0A8T2ARL0_9BRAS|nr:hypothetical protein ISN45_Aa03g001290 [Arabidopsis thaliana x Arabidopsis arenosa]
MLAHLEDHPDIYLSACEQEQTLNRDHAESEFCRCTGKSLIVMNNQSSIFRTSKQLHPSFVSYGRPCGVIGMIVGNGLSLFIGGLLWLTSSFFFKGSEKVMVLPCIWYRIERLSLLHVHVDLFFHKELMPSVMLHNEGDVNIAVGSPLMCY